MSRWVGLLAVLLGTGVSPSLAQKAATQTVTVQGRVLDAETNAPLPETHVFITQTMNGTVTDSTGGFHLNEVRPGVKRLYASRVGHTNKAFRFRATPGRTQVVTLRLTPEVLQSPPVTVSAERDEEWSDRLARFKRLFVGKAGPARQCVLVNPEVLQFEERWWGRFEAQAEKPIVIENRALGYRLTYFLKEFEKSGSVVRWDGEPLFERLTPQDSSEAARWRRNRRAAYRGSLRHFLRALLADQLDEERFDLYRLPRASSLRHTNHADRMPVERDRILEPGPDSTHLLNTHDRLEVVYRGEPEREAYLDWAALRRRPRDHQTSQIELNQHPIHVDRYGEIVESYGATLYRYFAYTARMAQLLPREYEPPE